MIERSHRAALFATETTAQMLFLRKGRCELLHEQPAADKRSNWLPAPASGPIRLLLRAYEPQEALLDGRYRLPPLRP